MEYSDKDEASFHRKIGEAFLRKWTDLKRSYTHTHPTKTREKAVEVKEGRANANSLESEYMGGV